MPRFFENGLKRFSERHGFGDSPIDLAAPQSHGDHLRGVSLALRCAPDRRRKVAVPVKARNHTALPALKATSAASVQLSVPVIAALGGIAFLGEPVTLRLVLASAAILGGIALVVLQKRAAPGRP